MNTNVESFFFAMISFNQVFTGRTVAELYNALYFRKYPFCEVAVFPNVDEAHYYIQQRYNANFLANPYLYGFAPMPLPSTSTKIGYNIRANDFVEINSDVVSENLPATINDQQCSLFAKPVVVQQNINDGLFWAVDAMNGFAVADNLNDLIHFLADSKLIYAHAVPYCDELSASAYSRSAYLNRFACRYGFNESIRLPVNPIRNGELFIDSDYEPREARRSVNDIHNQLMSFGFL